MGSCLVSSEIINSSKNVINMHTGLSPYYRGGATNFWPFITNELAYFGVTIHKMSTGIDSGDIIFTENLIYKVGDNYPEINCKAIIKGTELMINTIRNIINNKLRSIKQWDKGKIYSSYNYNHFYAYIYYKKLDRLHKINKRYLSKPTLVDNGNLINK